MCCQKLCLSLGGWSMSDGQRDILSSLQVKEQCHMNALYWNKSFSVRSLGFILPGWHFRWFPYIFGETGWSEIVPNSVSLYFYLSNHIGVLHCCLSPVARRKDSETTQFALGLQRERLKAPVFPSWDLCKIT